MDFKSVQNDYKPIPFWSWNEKLDPEETRRQIRLMHEAGMGGFFMHARGGLQTEYLGEEWFENVEAAVDEAEKLGMKAWAYDENGWPSGFGGGLVNGLGVEYQQKYLRMSETEPTENVIGKCGGHWFYYEVNPYYVDMVNKKVIKEFIRVAYEPYYERFGNRIEGFFTDEPQTARDRNIAWSFTYEEEYKNRYGEDIKEHLEELFLPVGDYKRTRIRFWKMVTDLFSENYFRQIYEWCEERGYKFTGHLLGEETLEWGCHINGATMPHYEYMHIPGVDWLGRNIWDCLAAKQIGSAAAQLGKKRVITESFALCGHNVSFAELKGIYEWQTVRGVNMLCQHLEGYSLRGIRKRDYPPAMFAQQPWWDEYERFNNGLTREGMILGESKASADVLLLHPQTTAWTLFESNPKPEKLWALQEAFIAKIKELEKKHIDFHFGDETLMERHAKVHNGKLIIGEQSYSYIITECCDELFDNTKRLLKEFENSGGKIVTIAEIEASSVIDNENITYTKRCADGYNVHFFVNTSPDTEYAKFGIEGKVLDIYTGELSGFCGEYEFLPWGSLLIIEDGSKNVKRENAPETPVSPDGEFKISQPVENCLTLDFCDYYFDGVLQEKNGYVLNVCERANKLERAVKIHQDYRVEFDYIPKTLFLVTETPERFDIFVNGEKIEKKIEGYFADKSFKRLDIAKYIKKGENVISFECDFEQSREFYENLKKSFKCESEKNKLCYDMEIEAVYLVGDFSVRCDGEWTKLDKNASRYRGEFVICEPKTTVTLSQLEKQGFAFWAGKMSVEGELDIKGENPVLDVNMQGINTLGVEIGGVKKIYFNSEKIYLKDFGASGKTPVKLYLTGNLRNLLGPHHLKEGECRVVCPSSFYAESCVWNENAQEQWDRDYCFVNVGIK